MPSFSQQFLVSTYVTELRIEKVNRTPEGGVIVWRKVRDLKGVYPKETDQRCLHLAFDAYILHSTLYLVSTNRLGQITHEIWVLAADYGLENGL